MEGASGHPQRRLDAVPVGVDHIQDRLFTGSRRRALRHEVARVEGVNDPNVGRAAAAAPKAVSLGYPTTSMPLPLSRVRQGKMAEDWR